MRLTKKDIEKTSDFDIYTSVDLDAAEELVSLYDGEVLSLNGLRDLSLELAEIFESHTYRLELNGLSRISDEVAEVLSRHDGDLGLDGLQELSSTSAEYFAQRDLDFGLFYLAGLKSLTNESGHVLLANHLGSTFDYDELNMNGIEILHEESAEGLAKHEGWLYLSGLKDPSEEVLRILLARNFDHGYPWGVSLKGVSCPSWFERSERVEFRD